MVISFIGFFAALILLIIFTMRGVNIIIAALVSSAILALTSGLPLEKALTVNYMDGFTGYFASWFLVYLLGAVFGKVMEETKAAEAIAEWIKIKVGANRAVFAVVTACALMTYGGVSIAISHFRYIQLQSLYLKQQICLIDLFQVLLYLDLSHSQ